MLNILGITRFLDMSFSIGGLNIPLVLPIGVLPYPITFLCTDFVSEIYGRKRANFLVLVGLGLNIWVIFILWLGANLPPTPEGFNPETQLPPISHREFPFFKINTLTQAAVTASMIAYLAAQFCDVYLFHFWKKLTKGKHLWLRNNGSTVVSQFVDTFAVLTITQFATEGGLGLNPDKGVWSQLWKLIGMAYVFKLTVALVDTIPFYIGTNWLRKYLQIPKEAEGY